MDTETKDEGLDGLMDTPSQEIKSQWTDLVLGQFISYQFQVDGTHLPCISANLNIDDFVKLIQVHEGVPAQIEREWKINEIFQREINYERIENDISYYLKSGNKTVYLPGITVVMHPLEPGLDRKILAEFGDYDPEDALPDLPAKGFIGKVCEKANTDKTHYAVDGLEIYIAWEDLCALRWDQTRVMAIAIDGQHRLKSIEKLLRDYKSAPPPEVLTTRIPVNFVLPVPEFGYSGGKSPRDVSRDIFADVNQNPVTPSASRMVLLNDSDIVSLCTRKLVTEKIPETYNGKRIPLQMIRWKEDKVPFAYPDWEFNSIMNLKKIVSSVLSLKGIQDGYDHEKVKDFIEDLRESMSVASFEAKISGTEKSLLQYYYDNFTEEENNEKKAFRPFVESQIEPPYLKVIVDEFINNHSSYILPVLTKITPYATYLSYCQKQDLFTGTFGGFNSQPKSHQRQISEPKNWTETYILPHNEELKSLKKEGDSINLSWYVIFQEALILNAKKIQFSQAGSHELLGDIDDYIENMNFLSDYFWTAAGLEGMDRYLWTYICTRPDNNNPATKSINKKRIESLLMLWHQVIQKDKISSTLLSIDELFELFKNDQFTADYPDAKSSVDTIIAGFTGFSEFRDGLTDETAILKANNRLKKILELPRILSTQASEEAAKENKNDTAEETEKAATEGASSGKDISFML